MFEKELITLIIQTEKEPANRWVLSINIPIKQRNLLHMREIHKRRD